MAQLILRIVALVVKALPLVGLIFDEVKTYRLRRFRALLEESRQTLEIIERSLKDKKLTDKEVGEIRESLLLISKRIKEFLS